MERDNCSRCKYFYHEAGDFGLCRRFPAQWTNDNRGFEFPVMKPAGWCGEFAKAAQ